jgi:hypothetical protein
MQSAMAGLTKKINSETKDFWEAIHAARLKTDKWPEWKKGININHGPKDGNQIQYTQMVAQP